MIVFLIYSLIQINLFEFDKSSFCGPVAQEHLQLPGAGGQTICSVFYLQNLDTVIACIRNI